MFTPEELREKYDSVRATMETDALWAQEMHSAITWRASELYQDYETYDEALEAAANEIFEAEAENWNESIESE